MQQSTVYVKICKVEGFEVRFFSLKKKSITFTQRENSSVMGCIIKLYLRVKSDEVPRLDKISISVSRMNIDDQSVSVCSAAANSYTEACTPSWQSASMGTEKTAPRLQPSSSKVSLHIGDTICLSVF